ncbi:hypothetical protein CASFOL_025027 [Castilleja foliolosa]|uniref:Phosphoglycerate kinase n=1 Tax=Castilleja foliolosa TaxID=1961234 RepID=A0ABD3CQX4_9LAMI
MEIIVEKAVIPPSLDEGSSLAASKADECKDAAKLTAHESDQHQVPPIVEPTPPLRAPVHDTEGGCDCLRDEVEKLVSAFPDGGVILLENVRFYKEEEKNDAEFAKKIASFADLYVNDAFGTAHRAHASTEGVTKYLKPSVAGFLMQKELDYLVGAVSNPKKPFAATVGGSKVLSKIGVIESLLEKVDILLLGGGMIFTFYKAQGLAVGSSLVEADKLDLATSLLEKAKSRGVSLLLPSDIVIADKFVADANSKLRVSLLLPSDIIIADKFAADANIKIVKASEIPDGWMGLDIGPDSIKSFGEALDSTKPVIWNGPMGVFEFDKFAAGTEVFHTAINHPCKNFN